MAEDLKRLTNDEVKEKLRAGESIEKCYIERLSISKMDFEKPIQIAECEIENLDLNRSTFKEDVVIRRSEIKTLVLSEATFLKKADFKKNKIGRGRVQRTTFQDAALFGETGFAYTSFHQSIFENKADFKWSSFFGDATFTEVTFKQGGDFNHVTFSENAIFKNSEWGDRANFSSVEVAKDLDLHDSKFKGELWLAEAVVKLTINLSHSELEGNSDLANVSAGRSVLMTGVKPGEKQGFRFSNMSSPVIILERDVVEGHIFPENDGKYRQASKEYGFLRTTFQNINRFDDEDWAYYQFKRMERLGTPVSLNPLKLLKRGVEYFFLDIGCGYGTKPFRTFGVCLIMILFFSFCYLASGISSPEKYGVNSVALNRFLHAFNISVTAFSGGYGDLNISGPLKLLAIIEYLLGVVFMGIFVVAFSRKVIR